MSSRCDRTIQIGITKFNAKTTFFENDKILRTIKLPMNYSDADLIRLAKENYTREELIFNNLLSLIEKAELKMEKDISDAYVLLKSYGVKHEDLVRLTKSKL